MQNALGAEGVADPQGWRVPREHHPVLSHEHNAALIARRNCAVEVFEIFQLHRAEHQSEEFAVLAAEAARQIDCPGPRSPILYWGADEGLAGRAGFERLEVIAFETVHLQAPPLPHPT